MKYTLSFYVKENQPYLKKPKWFEFWKRSKLVDNYIWVRKIANIDAVSDKEVLKIFDNEMFKDVLKQTHNEATHLQLEMNGNENTNYIQCTANKISSVN